MSNFEMWIHGLAAAFIGGGASAITTSVVAPAIQPQAFNLGSQITPLLKLAATVFIVNGAISAFAYLKQSPLPAQETVTTEKTSAILPSGDGGLTVTSTETINTVKK